MRHHYPGEPRPLLIDRIAERMVFANGSLIITWQLQLLSETVSAGRNNPAMSTSYCKLSAAISYATKNCVQQAQVRAQAG